MTTEPMVAAWWNSKSLLWRKEKTGAVVKFDRLTLEEMVRVLKLYARMQTPKREWTRKAA